jgi:hypothetical protein
MTLLRLLLGLGAVVMLHAVLFTPPLMKTPARLRRTNRR